MKSGGLTPWNVASLVRLCSLEHTLHGVKLQLLDLFYFCVDNVLLETSSLHMTLPSNSGQGGSTVR